MSDDFTMAFWSRFPDWLWMPLPGWFLLWLPNCLEAIFALVGFFLIGAIISRIVFRWPTPDSLVAPLFSWRVVLVLAAMMYGALWFFDFVAEGLWWISIVVGIIVVIGLSGLVGALVEGRCPTSDGDGFGVFGGFAFFVALVVLTFIGADVRLHVACYLDPTRTECLPRLAPAANHSPGRAP